MASSPWAYLRGAAAVMAADLASAPHSGLTVQMCGDAHILNFGLWASPERTLLFDARDFDETLPGPFEWDLKRLITSVYVLADAERLGGTCGEDAAAAVVTGYRKAMRRYARMGELDVWYDQITADVPLKGLTSESAHAATRAIEKQSRTQTHHGSAKKLVADDNGQHKIVLEPMKRIDEGMTEQQRIRASRQVYDTYLASIPPHLRRLVRLMQSAADIFLGHMRVDGTDYYVRQYRDMKIIPKGAQIAAYLPQFAKACGRTLAKAHARSGDPAAVVEYIGRGVAFEEEILRFARAYADQTHADHAELVAAIAAGEVRAEVGVA